MKLLDEVYPRGLSHVEIARAAKVGMSQTGIVLVELESKHLVQPYWEFGPYPRRRRYRINR